MTLPEISFPEILAWLVLLLILLAAAYFIATGIVRMEGE